MQIRALAYVGIEATDTAEWASFAEEVLGMPVTRPNDDESRILLRMDERTYRFDIRKADTDRLAWMGWEMSSAAALDQAEQELTAAGVTVFHGSTDDARERGIVDFIHFDDPAGNRLELFEPA